MASAQIVARTKEDFTVQITVPYGESMLSVEEIIQEKLNEAGTLMTGEVLERFDTDGSPIRVGGNKWTSKGKVAKPYQTPYGEVVIERHVYQSSGGGRIFCPLERGARIILTAALVQEVRPGDNRHHDDDLRRPPVQTPSLRPAHHHPVRA